MAEVITESRLKERAHGMRQRLATIPRGVVTPHYAGGRLGSLARDLFSLEDSFFDGLPSQFLLALRAHALDVRGLGLLQNGFFFLHRFPMQLYFTLRTHSLDADTLERLANSSFFHSAGIWHPHHLLRHPIRFLLVPVSGLVDL